MKNIMIKLKAADKTVVFLSDVRFHLTAKQPDWLVTRVQPFTEVQTNTTNIDTDAASIHHVVTTHS